ncbi:type II toxin-antitoxin system RelE/ParE family toxin [Gordonia sp. ABSL1-1]|uniref:type II toxin-antitoxin system RelE family toxin n=1 Tax=Gordonia sp. ABSL1-1 TaxID=3053923 RepID=UPI002572DA62|nr:type II toxin-antitoxin system RelE/ParE family toxin [Gordonia sp. ABSL1-1]MDL9938665.1 type II toxin-antitoxin system RelE/ParE family toxin [Gordonia sp. ABSL1-1]
MSESGYHVEIEAKAVKALQKIARADQRRIVSAAQALSINPRPDGCKKLTAQDAYRIRIGNYRVIYVVEDAVRIVTVTRIGHRREVYDR